MRKLVIIATKFNNTPEANEVFQQRGWQPIEDKSTISRLRKLVERNRHSTPLIDLNWEEYEYAD